MTIGPNTQPRRTRPGPLLEQKAAALAVDLAMAASRGESIEHQLTVQGPIVLEADVGAGMTVLDPSTYAVARMVSTHAGFTPAAAQAATDVVARHPAFVAMARLGTTAPVRVSDVTSLRWFWTTECFARTDGHVGSRYAMGALLHADAGTKIVVGMHRHQRDFGDRQVEALAMLQRPIAAALTFRRRLDDSVAIVRDGRPSARRQGQVSPAPGLDLAGQLCTEYRPTRREAEVLTLATQGWTNRQIGRLLGITERTVRKHLSAVYDKAGVRGRAAASSWWQRLRKT